MATSPDGPHPQRHQRPAFEVNLDNFSGPFDLLLSLIAKHRLDVTEVALAVVTDDFMAFLRSQDVWELEQASEFLIIGATLLDLKTARLLPGNDADDPEDLELLEARDLLFARLLQYRAYKDVGADLEIRWREGAGSFPRNVSLEPRFAQLLPDLVLAIGPEDLAQIAARALAPRQAPEVGLDHLHAPAVSVREQAALIVARLRRHAVTTFRALTQDAGAPGVVIARFLALLDLYREGVLAFEQPTALGELTIRWTGGERTVELSSEFDGGADDEVAPSEPAQEGEREPLDLDDSGDDGDAPVTSVGARADE